MFRIFILVLFSFLILPQLAAAKTVPECTTEKIADQGLVSPLAKADGSCPDDATGNVYICTIQQKDAGGKDTLRCYKSGGQDAAEVVKAIREREAGVARAAAPAGPAAPLKKGYAYGLPCTAASGVNADPTKIPAAGYDGFMTAIGCIPSKPDALVAALIKYASFAAGGIAFLLMILAALQMITAEGNPESIKKAQEKFYSAIIGLLLIIFSVLLMQVIGVDILGLPGFGKQ